MKSEQKHTDDFKKLFDAHHIPELPADLEEKVMMGVAIHQLKEKRKAPNWLTTNFVIFCLSLVVFALLSVVQYSTPFKLLVLQDVKLLLLCSTGIFFILWIIESAEELLQAKLSKRLS